MRLEDSLVEYQGKNWQMEQENKDLNGQLDDLRSCWRKLRRLIVCNLRKRSIEDWRS